MVLLTALGMAWSLGVQHLSGDPLDVRFVTSDIPNFWKAYDAAKNGDGEIAFRDMYFKTGSDGLKAFIGLRLKDPKTFAANVEKLRFYYDGLPRDSKAIDAQIPKMRAALLAFKNLYPEAKFPTVYFLVGQASTGGTTAPPGLLIGAEMYSKTPTTDLSKMGPWLKRVLSTPDTLPAIVAHELVHYNQKGLAFPSLLARSINEGAADFIGELSSGQQVNTTVHTYGRAHEAELWTQFQAEMDKPEVKNWMYNGDQGDRPADLGYFMGYRITEAYYNKAKDKRAAIKAILEGKDFKKILKESGYKGQ